MKTPEAPVHWNNPEASAWQQGWEAGRRMALEEAAKVAELYAQNPLRIVGETTADYRQGYESGCIDNASAIEDALIKRANWA